VGYLLFGKEPRSRFPQAGLSLTIKFNNGKEVIEDFFMPEILIPNELEKYLRNKFFEIVDRNSMVHNKINEIPIELIRESVVNALLHRDYSIQGANCHLLITENRFEIWSPGRPVSQISLEQLNAFNAPMFNRNPQIAYLFSLCHLAEQRGLGMSTFRTAEMKYSIPKPFYKFEDPYLIMTIFRSQSAILSKIPIEFLNQFSDNEQILLQNLFSQGDFSREKYKSLLNLSNSTALRQIRELLALGLITQTGAGPSVKYIVVGK
jgi:ATP-dependent DNA helicase RecG